MSNPFRSDTATAPPAITLLDILEFNAASDVHVISRGAYQAGGTGGVGVAATLAGSLHPVNVGTVVTTTLFEGTGCYQLTSANGVLNGRQGLSRLIPIGANRANDPTAALRPMRHTFEALLIRAAGIVASTGFGYGFRRTNGLQGLNATTPGIAVESITTINGGNWTIFQRNVNAGAQTSTDTGIPGTTRLFFQLVYEDTTNPRLRIRLNGATALDLIGLANLPALTGAEILDNGFFQGDATLTGVGQVDRVRQGRYKLEALTGFDL